MVELNFMWLLFLIGLVVILAIALTVLFLRYKKGINRYDEELDNRTSELKFEIERTKVAAKAKSDFLSRMSHEIRTPLNAILGMLQIIRNTKDQCVIDDSMNKMEDSSRHLIGIINDILDFSKIESGKLSLNEKFFSLSNDMDFVVSMFKDKVRDKNIDLKVDMNSIQHDGIHADELRLNQVLINLISNAVKFTDEDGEVVIRTEEIAHMDGESVYRFTVMDNGVGINPEQAKKLFTAFTQANDDISRLYGGTGLGLAISQSLVQMMGGEIELETSPGKGTVFQFTIKVKAKDKVEDKFSNIVIGDAPEKLKGKRLLVVDDIDINREIVTTLLGGSGAIIETAKNGQEAVMAYMEAEPYTYDLIFMDMLMPVMNGINATKVIRGSDKVDASSIKIIAMTANVMPGDMESAYAVGMNDYLAKPVELITMYGMLEKWL